MKNSIKIVAVFIIILSAVSCYYDKAELIYNVDTANCDTTAIKYSTDVVGILTGSCYACHSGAAGAGGGIKLDTYASLKTYVNNGKLKAAITHTPGVSAMPKGGGKLNNCSINKIVAWINNGAPNN